MSHFTLPVEEGLESPGWVTGLRDNGYTLR